jgi:hypothetical protein
MSHFHNAPSKIETILQKQYHDKKAAEKFVFELITNLFKKELTDIKNLSLNTMCIITNDMLKVLRDIAVF